MITKSEIGTIDTITLLRIRAGMLVGMEVGLLEGRVPQQCQMWVNRINRELARREAGVEVVTK